MRNTIIFLVLILFSSCLTQKRAVKKLDKIAKNFPELIEERNDTIIEVWEITQEVFIEADTAELYSEWDDANVDSIVYRIGDSIFITEVRLVRDTLVKFSVRTEVFADTIRVVLTDTIETIINTTEYVTKIDKKIPWWIWVLISFLSLSILILLVRKKE